MFVQKNQNTEKLPLLQENGLHVISAENKY